MTTTFCSRKEKKSFILTIKPQEGEEDEDDIDEEQEVEGGEEEEEVEGDDAETVARQVNILMFIMGMNFKSKEQKIIKKIV